jgi:hypothetical protein
MRVLVAVQVRDADADTLQLLDLGERFADNVFLTDAAKEKCADELGKCRPESLTIRAEQTGDGFWWGDRRSVGEDDVATNSERGVSVGDSYGIVEGPAVGHQSGGGEDPGSVQLADRPVDAWSEAEVIGIQDQACGHCGRPSGPTPAGACLRLAACLTHNKEHLNEIWVDLLHFFRFLPEAVLRLGLYCGRSDGLAWSITRVLAYSDDTGLSTTEVQSLACPPGRLILSPPAKKTGSPYESASTGFCAFVKVRLPDAFISAELRSGRASVCVCSRRKRESTQRL